LKQDYDELEEILRKIQTFDRSQECLRETSQENVDDSNWSVGAIPNGSLLFARIDDNQIASKSFTKSIIQNSKKVVISSENEM